MKGIKKCLALLVTGCLLVSLAACGGEEPVREVAYELPYYDGNYTEELGDPFKPAFNGELWRRADISIDGADPMVLDDTARYMFCPLLRQQLLFHSPVLKPILQGYLL